MALYNLARKAPCDFFFLGVGWWWGGRNRPLQPRATPLRRYAPGHLGQLSVFGASRSRATVWVKPGQANRQQALPTTRPYHLPYLRRPPGGQRPAASGLAGRGGAEWGGAGLFPTVTVNSSALSADDSELPRNRLISFPGPGRRLRFSVSHSSSNLN